MLFRSGVDEAALAQYMADELELPDRLLLRTVDIILADRQSRPPLAGRPATRSRWKTAG